MSGEVRTYSISVEGFPSHLYCARSPAKARARCWAEYRSYADCSFRDFLSRSSIRRVANPPGVGERILVADEPATRVLGGPGYYVSFMRDGSDVILHSHPLDVAPFPSVMEATP